MPVEHIALLKIARELHNIPRGMERFQAYLNTITNEAHDDVQFPPLVAMNPMGKDHIPSRLDELLAFDGDAVAAQAISKAGRELGRIEGDFKHGLVVMDDVHGGWTNRTTNDLAFRSFSNEAVLKRRWITTPLWASELQSPKTLQQAVRMSICRLHYVQQHGAAHTLGALMRQEGASARFAGYITTFDEEELEYSRAVLTPYHDSSNYPLLVAALYGDVAARSLGYEPLGLSANAGFEVALANALAIAD